ncbi:ShlB/FhaC/HecB family hemolysin secretion/activation protein [Hydrogenophaga sp.]|uniref:ShlB/FhaC/HecB family hemolysin secretion/activation protein n=1 Tax=Hydrogenophaga sp. TaxID=1904254 RepID=UPI003F6C66A3
MRLPATATAAPGELPANETPCFVIRELSLQGADAGRFAWVLDAVGGNGALPSPLGRCLGAQGVGVLIERAQNALLERGFVTSRALAAPQSLAQGLLTITVLPGRIRAIRLQNPNDERARLVNALPMNAGDILNLRDIEQGLENLKRVPTADADIQIVPADEPGQSDLVVNWRQSLPFRLSLGADDSGSRSSGKYQGNVTLSYDNPLTLNDLFYLSLNRDLGGGAAGARGTRGGTAYYAVPVGYWLFNVSANRSRYFQTVAGASQDYVYRGTSAGQEMAVSRLVQRNASAKTTLALKAFTRQSNNFIDDTEVEVQRRRVGGWQLGVEHRAYLDRATLDLGLSYKRGTGAFGSLPAPEEAFGEGTSRFALVQANASVSMPFTLAQQSWRYSGQWRAQVNRTPLTPQDRFAIGGRYTVRGFDGESSLVAERGWLVRNEIATRLGESGPEFFVGFDHGRVAGPSSEQLVGTRMTGAVLGLRGNVAWLQYEVFPGMPVRKPEGFSSAHATYGFQLNAGF